MNIVSYSEIFSISLLCSLAFMAVQSVFRLWILDERIDPLAKAEIAELKARIKELKNELAVEFNRAQYLQLECEDLRSTSVKHISH